MLTKRLKHAMETVRAIPRQVSNPCPIGAGFCLGGDGFGGGLANAALNERFDVAFAVFDSANQLDEFRSLAGGAMVRESFPGDAQDGGDFGLREKFGHLRSPMESRFR